MDGVTRWTTVWYVPTAIAAAVLVVFIFLFREKKRASAA
ncbi:MAG: hypothetical protein ACWGNV_18205 [Bacteroidales bacterium]